MRALPIQGAPMLIRMKKTTDGVVLSCIRDDGPAAVQRTRHGGFFALHDLMHYSVESVLGFDRAFYGLVASGWDFATFTDKSDPRYQALPAQALLAEHLVAILSRHHRPALWRDAELLPLLASEVAADLAREAPLAGATPPSEPQVARILERFDSLVTRWAELPLGGYLEVHFPARS